MMKRRGTVTMAFAQTKRFAYLLRKAFLIPVGVMVGLVGVIGCVYYLPDYRQVTAEIRRVQGKLLNDADQVLGEHPDWPAEVKNALNQFKDQLRQEQFTAATETALRLRQFPASRGNGRVFLLRGDTEILIYAGDYTQGMLRSVLVTIGVIFVGLCCVAIGYTRARQVGKYIATDQLMGNLKKLEMPEFPTKDFLRKLNVETIRLFIVVNKFGHVADVELIEGPKVILPYIVRAVRKWKFDPFIYKGKDTAVFGELRINVK
jgi:hypothetical protein